MSAASQQDLPLEQRFRHGGARKGAGRPRKRDAGVSHAPRGAVTRHLPAHVTLRLRAGLPSLRACGRHRVVERALAGVLARVGFRVVHYSILTNHLHLVVEADDAVALSRGVQALAIRIAKGLNRLLQRRGPVFRDRFHARVLRTPSEARRALCYVLQNFRRHATDAHGIVDPGWLDPLSSAAVFDGWRGESPFAANATGAPARCTSAAASWLLTAGWRRRGLIGIDEVPAAALR